MLGGVALSGGRGSAAGIAVGALTYSALQETLGIMGAPQELNDVITGAVLLTGAGRRGLDNPMFMVKLWTMAGAILATAVLQLSLSADISFWELTPGRRAAAKLIAPVCFLLWLATVFAGRWLAYSSSFFPPNY